MNKPNVYQTTTIGKSPTRNDMSSRWTAENTSLVKNAIIEKIDLPRIFEPIQVEFLGKEITLEDLRGINLHGTDVGEYDLAFCALDFSILDNCNFTGTSLQYSRLFKASLKNSIFSKVQASPIDGRYADFSDARLTDCYISNSDLTNAHFQGVNIERCDLSSSEMPAIVTAVKREREKAKLRFGNLMAEGLYKINRAVNDLREDFNLIGVGGNQAQYGRLHVGTVLSLAAGNRKAVARVRVFAKKKTMSNGKIISRPMTFLVDAGSTRLYVGQTVEIINKKEDGRAEKQSKGRSRRNSKIGAVNQSKTGSKWLISKVG